MNTDNGALEFDAYINNDRLMRSAKEAENRIKGLSDSTVKESQKMESAFSEVGKTLALVGGTAAITMLGKQIIDTTAKFEKFGIVLRNTLGEQEGNDALDMIAKFAATTPFQLDEVTGAFIKMANQGFVPTRDEMVKLGDVASSTGKSFDQLAEALLDAQTGQFERLKEFGIKASQNGDKVTFSFKEQQTTVDNTNSAIQAYILSLGELQGVQGANAKISESLTGQLSNLEDKLAAMYNEIGKANSGVIYAAVGGVSTLIENYELVGKVLVGLVATYGAYKTAIILSTAVTNGYTIAQQIELATLLLVEKAQKALNRTMLANPYVAAAVAVTALAAGLAIYLSTVNDVNQAEKSKQTVQKKATEQYEEQKDKITALTDVLNNEKIAIGERRKALTELQGIIPAYHANLTEEGKLIDNNREAINEYLKSLEKQIYLSAIMDEKIELTKKKRQQEKEVAKRQVTQSQGEAAAREARNSGASSFGAGSAALILSENDKTVVKNAQKELEETTKALKALDDEYVKFSNTVKEKSASGPRPETEAERKKREAEEKRDQKERERNLKDFNDEALDAQKRAYQADLDLKRSQIQDKKALIDLELQNTLYGINEQEKIYKEKAKIAGIKNPDLSVFAGMRTTAQNQANTNKGLVDQEVAKQQKEKLDEYLNKFRTFQGQLADIERKYHEDSLLLNKAYLASKNSLEEAQIQDSIKARNEAYEREKSALKVEELMASPDWTMLFSDLSAVTVDEMIRLRDKIEAEFSSLKLDPKDLESLRNKLKDVTNEVLQRNPFKALSEALKNYKENQSKANFTDLFKSLSASANATKNVFDQLVGSLDKLGISTSDSTDKVLSDISGMIGGAGDLAMGIATGNPMQIIQGSIDLIANGIDLIAGAKDRKLDESIKRHAAEVERLTIAYEDLQRAVDKALGSDRYASQKATIDNLKKQQLEYAAMARDERAKKKTDNDKVKEYEAGIKSNANAIADTISRVREEILTMDVSSAANQLGDAIIDAFASGEDAALAWGKKVDDIVGNVIRKMLVQKLVEEPVGKIINKYMAQWVDGNGNFLGFDAVMSSAKAMGAELQGLGSGMSAALATLPDDIKKYFIGDNKAGNTSPLTGSIQNVSQETASIISGQLNAMRINQSESLQVLRNQLISLNRIEQNTAYSIHLVKLVEMLDVLKTIANNNTLRSQGL